jgi:asparagine synthase (glutamine-hydrolysing)
MCGIAGVFDRSLNPVAPATVEGMLRVIKHRGPDDDGTYCDQGVGLGSCRLSILDLSPAGHQPMIDEETGNCIVHNGEIYNYKELRESLGLTGFKSQSDTEVILKAYAKYGIDCVQHFNGIYGFCIWDPRNKRLVCARDRLGIKPFFYSLQNGRFLFGSEIKSLLECGVPRRPNMGIIYDYLARGTYDHSEETFFDGVRQLPPGHTLTIEPDRFEIRKYWDLASDSEGDLEASWSGRYTEEEAEERFVDLLTDSIRLQLRSDVPVAVHISGGLDSTLLLHMVDKVNGGQGALKAFSYKYGEEKYDESPFVDKLVKRFDWDVEFYQVEASEIPDLAERAMWHQEQPYPGIITLAKHKLIEASHGFGAKVILEGQGGDEIGGGYQYYFGPHILDLIQAGQPQVALRELQAFGRLNNMDTDGAFALVANGLSAFYQLGASADGTSFVKTHCLQPDFLASCQREMEFPKPFRSNLLNMQYRDILHTKLPRILRSCDRASMAHGRELRVPFLDHRLVEFSFSLPGALKIKDGVQRHFIREAMKRFSSDPLFDLPKRAVVDPQREWLKGPLSSWVQEILSSRSFEERGIFDQSRVEEEYRQYRSEAAPLNSFHIWQWISLELWFRTFMD